MESSDVVIFPFTVLNYFNLLYLTAHWILVDNGSGYTSAYIVVFLYTEQEISKSLLVDRAC